MLGLGQLIERVANRLMGTPQNAVFIDRFTGNIIERDDGVFLAELKPCFLGLPEATARIYPMFYSFAELEANLQVQQSAGGDFSRQRSDQVSAFNEAKAALQAQTSELPPEQQAHARGYNHLTLI